MIKLSNQQQRWVAVGLLFGVIAIVAILVITPWYNALNHKLNAIDEQIFRLKRYQRVIMSRDEVLAAVRQRDRMLKSLGYFIEQTSTSLANAALQKRITDIVAHAGGDLNSIQVLPIQEENDLLRVAVKIRLYGNMEMLRNILYTINTEKPLMIINSLNVVPSAKRRNPRTRQMESTPNVIINLEVAGYMRKKV